jgi:hypothetical protein
MTEVRMSNYPDDSSSGEDQKSFNILEDQALKLIKTPACFI